MKDYLESVRDKANRRGVQFMDVRLFESDHTSVRVQDTRADKVSQGRSLAVGLRVLMNDAWGFASTDVVDHESLEQCLDTALEMAKASGVKVVAPGVVAHVEPVVDSIGIEVEQDPRSVSLEEKVKRVLAYEKAGLDCGQGKLCNTLVGYGDFWSREIGQPALATVVATFAIRPLISRGWAPTVGSRSVRGPGRTCRRPSPCSTSRRPLPQWESMLGQIIAIASRVHLRPLPERCWPPLQAPPRAPPATVVAGVVQHADRSKCELV